MPASFITRVATWLRFLSGLSSWSEARLVTAAFLKHKRFEAPLPVWQQIDALEGYLNRKEAGLLYWAASHWPAAGPVVELGSFEGRSTGAFALGGRHVHAVDAWSGDVSDLSAFNRGGESASTAMERFTANIRKMGIEDKVTVHRGLTHEIGRAWGTPGAILLVDAGHAYDDVRRDLETWSPHLLPAGLLLMHDVLGGAFPGVLRAAGELRRSEWRVVASTGSLVGFVRR
jgi:MMP 1-O-methyltransferase